MLVTNNCIGLFIVVLFKQANKLNLTFICDEQLESLCNTKKTIILISAEDADTFLESLKLHKALIHPMLKFFPMVLSKIIRHYHFQITQDYFLGTIA